MERGCKANWCNFIVEKCDLSGIRSLTIDQHTFTCNKSEFKQFVRVLKVLAAKFINLKYLKFNYYWDKNHSQEYYSLLFCEFLKHIIAKITPKLNWN